MNTTDKTPAVVLGTGINALSIIRSLGEKGIPIINVVSGLDDYSVRSRYISKVQRANLKNGNFTQTMTDIGQSLHEKTVLFPTSDLHVLLISENRDSLKGFYSFILPPHNVVELLMNKKLFYEFSLSKGFNVPKTYFTNSWVDIIKVADAITFPCIIKPEYHDEFWESSLMTKYGIKVLQADSKQCYYDLFDRFPIADRPLIIQEWIEGDDTDVYFCLTYINKAFETVGAFTGRKIRQYPLLTGSTSLAEGSVEPIVRDMALQLLVTAQCTGISSVEFKRSRSSNVFFITEPTVGRVDTQVGISIQSGIDIPYFYYCEALGDKLTLQRDQHKRITWINEPYDIYSVREYLSSKKMSIRDLIKSYGGKRAYALWSLQDPGPFTSFLKDMLTKALKKVFLSKSYSFPAS